MKTLFFYLASVFLGFILVYMVSLSENVFEEKGFFLAGIEGIITMVYIAVLGSIAKKRHQSGKKILFPIILFMGGEALGLYIGPYPWIYKGMDLIFTLAVTILVTAFSLLVIYLITKYINQHNKKTISGDNQSAA